MFVEYALAVPPLVLVFELNPKTLSHNRTVVTNTGSTLGTRGDYSFTLPTETPRVAQGVEVEPETVSIQVLLDATDRMDQDEAVARELGIQPEMEGSRYQDAVPFAADGAPTFEGVRPRAIGAAGDVVEHLVRAGDRLDLLARHYYNDERLWWRILDANPDLLHGAELMTEAMEGQVILIPRGRE